MKRLISLLLLAPATLLLAQDDAVVSVEKANSHGVWPALQEAVFSLGEDFINHLPFIFAGLMILIITWIANSIIQRAMQKITDKTRIRGSLQDLILRMISIAVWFAGLMVASIVTFPGMSPGNVIGALGLASVAIGFAFKDIFENFFAGILILWNFPFEKGDIIEVNDIVGKVEDVTIRMTQLRRATGELVLIPNAILFKNPVEVLTNMRLRRYDLTTGVAYSEDVGQALQLIEQTVKACSLVEEKDKVHVFAKEFGSSSIDIEVRFWSKAGPADMMSAGSEVIVAIKKALDDAGIEIPFPYRTMTFSEPLKIQQLASE